MNKILFAGFGEILWDVFPSSEQLGGAPANFAYHIGCLGGIGIPISTIGTDTRGQNTLTELTKRNITLDAIATRDDLDTGYVTATLNAEGVATYTFPDNVAWDHLALTDAAEKMLLSLEGICFGTLAQRSRANRELLRTVISSMRSDALVIFDVNFRQDFYSQEIVEQSLEWANVLKVNDEELRVLAAMFQLSGSDEEQLRALCTRFSLQLAALTRGPHGSLLVTPDEAHDNPGTATQVVSTVGAGDCFTAALAMGMYEQDDLQTISYTANALASYVCTQQGAMPEMEADLPGIIQPDD